MGQSNKPSRPPKYCTCCYNSYSYPYAYNYGYNDKKKKKKKRNSQLMPILMHALIGAMSGALAGAVSSVAFYKYSTSLQANSIPKKPHYHRVMMDSNMICGPQPQYSSMSYGYAPTMSYQYQYI